MGFPINVSQIPQMVIGQVEAELPSRAVRAARELTNAKNLVLRGQRSGRNYGGHITSAPGEPPANWSGHLRASSFHEVTNDAHLPAIESTAMYANYLELGTSKMKPRPFRQKILDMAFPKIEAIYQETWHISI